MTADQLFQKLLKKIIAPLLKEYGFIQKGQYFYVKKGESWGVIYFQKSTKSSSDEVIFTVNIGVTSEKIFNFFAHKASNVAPSIDDCQWRERLGFLLNDNRDKWWTIKSEESLKNIEVELCHNLPNVIMQELNKYLNGEALRDLWLSGRSPGLTEIQRLMNLSVLLNDLGPKELLSHVLSELERLSKGKPTASMVERYLERLRGRTK